MWLLRWLARIFGRTAPKALPRFSRHFWRGLANALRSNIESQLARYRDILARCRQRPDDAALRARLREELDYLTKLRGELNHALDMIKTAPP